MTDDAYCDLLRPYRRGRRFAASITYTFQNYLSENYPEFARHDAFGSAPIYASGLSTLSGDKVSNASRLMSPMASMPLCDSSRALVVARAAMTRGPEGR